MRLLRGKVSSCDCSASVIAGFDLDVRNVSCLVCHQQCMGEDNSWDMVACLRVCERALQNSPAYCYFCVDLLGPSQLDDKMVLFDPS